MDNISHGQQHARSAGDALLGTSVLHQRLEVGHFSRREVEEMRRSSPHPPNLPTGLDYVEKLGRTLH